MTILFYAYTLVFNSIISILLGLFVLSKKPTGQPNQTWCLSVFSVAIWSFFFALSILESDYQKALLNSKISNTAAAYVSVFLVHFCLSITNGKASKNKILWAGYISCIFITLFAATDHFLDVGPASIFPYYPKAKLFYNYFSLHFFSFFFYQEFLLWRALRQISDTQKQNQIKYILAGITSGYIGGASSFFLSYGIDIQPVLINFVWVYALIISYAIVKHQIMNINVIIRRSFVYSLLIALITFIYLAVVLISEYFFRSFLGYRSIFIALVASSLIAIAFNPIRSRLQSFIDRAFFKIDPEALLVQNAQMKSALQDQDRLKAISTLAAGMAHEIKNPLTAIRTFAEYLPQKYDDPEFRDKFQRIVTDEVDRVNNIVKQLLEFSKPKDPDLKPTPITELLDETLSLLGNNLVSGKVELVKNYDAHDIVRVDKNQMKQAFLNLFLNGIQAMPTGGKLTVSTRRSGDDLMTTISDTGAGIPKENLARIFEPFFTTRQEGTGLGLSIVHGIISKHGGRLIVESPAGSGAVFSVVLKI